MMAMAEGKHDADRLGAPREDAQYIRDLALDEIQRFVRHMFRCESANDAFSAEAAL